MSESEQLICQFFVRALSGIVALVVGTGLCYYLFIGGFLQRLEHYKERLRVYKDLDKRSGEIAVLIGILRRSPEWVDTVGQKFELFNQYINGEDRLFMSAGLKEHCQHIIRTLEQLKPDHRYPEPSRTVEYPDERLSGLDSEFKLLRRLIEDEIETTRFGVPPELITRWSQVKQRVSGWGKR